MTRRSSRRSSRWSSRPSRQPSRRSYDRAMSQRVPFCIVLRSCVSSRKGAPILVGYLTVRFGLQRLMRKNCGFPPGCDGCYGMKNSRCGVHRGHEQKMKEKMKILQLGKGGKVSLGGAAAPPTPPAFLGGLRPRTPSKGSCRQKAHYLNDALDGLIS